MLNAGPVWGIDIGDRALKAVKLKRTGEQIALLDYRIIRYSDVTGDPAARREGSLLQALAELEAAGLGRDKCVVSIAPQTVFSRFISLPPVDKRRVPEIVLYEARQQIPFSLDEVIWAYETVRKEFIPGEEIEIGLFAVKREVIDSYLAELASISKQLHGVQMAPLALYNFVRYDVSIDQAAVIIDVGAQSTDLIIIDGPKFWLRNLPIAGNAFTSILEKRLNLPAGEAEKLKCVVAESRHRKKLLEVLRPAMRDLVAEIQRSIGYYKSLSQDVKFDEVFVVGDGYRLFGLDRFLAEQLQYRITPIRQLQKIAYQGPPARAGELNNAMSSLGVAIGLALQGLDRATATTNLLPDDFLIRRELHAKRFNGLIAAALLWAVVGCFYLQERKALSGIAGVMGKGDDTVKQVEQLKRDLIDARKPPDPRKYDFVRNLGKHREYRVRIIDAVARVIPRGIRVTAFTIGEGAVTPQEFMGVGGMPGMPGRGAVPGMRGGVPGMRGGGSMVPGRGGAPGLTGTGRRGGGPRAGGRLGTGGPPARGVGDTRGVILSFNAACAAKKEAAELDERLRNELYKATIYPEGVKIVKNVFVGQIATTTVAMNTDLVRAGEMELSAAIRVVVRFPEEVDEQLRKLRAKSVGKAQAKAAPEPASEFPKPPEGRTSPARPSAGESSPGA